MSDDGSRYAALIPAEVSRLLTTATPCASEGDAEAICADHFGIPGRAKLLGGEKDLNFKIVAKTGDAFVLKVANSAEDPAVTDLSTQALLHFEGVRPDIPLPRMMRARDGASAIVATLGKTNHVVRLLTYLQGEPLYSTPSSVAQRRALGRFLADVAGALQSFEHLAARHEILWDIKHIGCLLPLTLFIPDEGRRNLAQRAIRAYLDFVKPIEGSLRSQVVHNDFNPHNILVDPLFNTRVTGLLDFGDMVATPLVYDIAIAASYLLPDAGDPLLPAVDFVSAYHEDRPLELSEADALFDLIAARHAMTVTITEWRASLDPRNRAYILKNNPRASRGMQVFADIARSHGRASFRRACNMEPAS